MPFKPRVLQTHLPYSALPSSIRSLGCRIIYIARNPKDTVVSFWQFIHKFVPAVYDIHGADTSLKAVFDAFCSGVCNFGPFCEHVNATKDHPNILFLNYEDMKAIRRIADFLGLSSLTDEEIERIHGQCSFEGLSALEVNQTGQFKAVGGIVDSKIFFRKGEVGDWKNYLTVEMNGRLESIVEKKLDGSDFCFRYE